MQNRTPVFFGGFLVAVGAMFLAANVLNINLWRFFVPGVLILIGLSMIFRRSREGNIPHHDKLIGDLNLVVNGHPYNEEVWIGIGDIDLDMSRASFPVGLTTYRFSGFVGDINVVVPAGVGVKVKTANVVSDIKLGDQQEEAMFSTVELATPNYANAERKLELLTSLFVGDIQVRLPGSV
jgi:lia operon protein LiaF